MMKYVDFMLDFHVDYLMLVSNNLYLSFYRYEVSVNG